MRFMGDKTNDTRWGLDAHHVVMSGYGHGDHALSSEQAEEIWQAHSAFIDVMSRHGIKWGDMVTVERARMVAALRASGDRYLSRCQGHEGTADAEKWTSVGMAIHAEADRIEGGVGG
jgi:hypothetical protein